MSVAACESLLAQMHGKKHCILTGSGTAALWMASLLMHKSKEKVLLPAIVCPNVVYAVKMAGKRPVFADVLISDCTIDPELIEHSLKADSSIGAIMAVHLYGHGANMRLLREIADRHQVLLIEDVAQAMGGIGIEGELLGSLGDCAVFSFGKTKIIEVGEGGALITDNDKLANKARLIARDLRPPTIVIEDFFSVYRNLYFSIYNAGCRDARFFTLFDQFADLFRDMYLFEINLKTADAINMALSQLDEEILHRRNISTLYRETLKGICEINLFVPTGGMVPWRFSFCVDSKIRPALLDVIRSRGFDASSWYPCVANWFDAKGKKEQRYPVASRIEMEVVNLWVTRNYDKKRVKSLSDTIPCCIQRMPSSEVAYLILYVGKSGFNHFLPDTYHIFQLSPTFNT